MRENRKGTGRGWETFISWDACLTPRRGERKGSEKSGKEGKAETMSPQCFQLKK